MLRFYLPKWGDMTFTKKFTLSHAELMNIIIKAKDNINEIKEILLKLDILDMDV
jgi:hypothetical protein